MLMYFILHLSSPLKFKLLNSFTCIFFCHSPIQVVINSFQSFLQEFSHLYHFFHFHNDPVHWAVIINGASHSVMSDLVTPWTLAHQAPLPMEFSRLDYWNGQHSLLQGTFPTKDQTPVSHNAVKFFTIRATSEDLIIIHT